MKTQLQFILLSISLLFFIEANSQASFNLKIFLEGPFNGSSMNTDLNGKNLIPLNQPYNTAPWNYTGTELVQAIPNSSVVDWVLIELRETTGDASTATPDKMIHRQAAFLKSDGQIVGLDGASYPVYTGIVSSNLYVIIRHRNHLAVMSSGPLTESAGVYSWDFTDQQSKAFLNGQKEIASGVCGMNGGDCDGSGRTIQKDKILSWEDRAGFYGYYSSDLNLDGQVDNDDKDWVYVPNIGQSAQLPEGTAWECGMDMTDSRDGQIYSTVQIGDQCWMAENLNIGTMIDAAVQMSDNEIIEKYCQNNSNDSCAEYGGLYQWNELMQYAPEIDGICPSGWHVSTDQEFIQLTEYLGGWDVAGNSMKETGYRHWYSPNDGSTNSSGFTAFAGGFTDPAGTIYPPGSFCDFWVSTGDNSENGMRWWLANGYSGIGHNTDYPKGFGFSVRCVKDTLQATWSCGDPLLDTRDNQSYNTVQIGEQCWMAENLDIGHMIEPSQSQSDNSILEKYCYNGIQDSCDVYGGLYQWNEMMQYDTIAGRRGICPTGWHLPTDEEWKELEGAADSQYGYPDPEWNTTGFRGFDAGKNLKSQEQWLLGGNEVDLFGFKVLPGGNVSNEGLYDNIGAWADFWTSNNMNESGISRDFGHYSNESWRDIVSATYAFSVRCVKNTAPLPWSCGDPIIDTRDNQSYNTVQIGDQCWMAENLDIGHMIEPSQSQSDNSILEKYCYNGTHANCDVYGGLYQWNEMMEYDTIAGRRGICPTGWHLPTDEEWKVLEGSADSQFGYPDPVWDPEGYRGFDVGKNLKSVDGWFLNEGGVDLYGFNAKPNGNLHPNGTYENLTSWSRFWTSTHTPGSSTDSYTRNFGHMTNQSHRMIQANTFAYGVRCLRDIVPQPWSCGDPIIDSRDNQSYNTVQIGEQCWMAQNLNVGLMIDRSQAQSDNSILEKYCFNTIQDSCDVYGGLYQWDEMMQYDTVPGQRGICPTGWHVPTDEEWKELEGTVDTQYPVGDPVWNIYGYRGFDAGGNLKETGTTHWILPNAGATNYYGFNGIPSGYGEPGGYYGIGSINDLWSSSQYLTDYVWVRHLIYESATTGRYTYEKYLGFSVRCLKDTEPQPWSCGDPLIDTRDSQSYNTVQIGDQCWMAENLNTGTLIQSTNAPDDNNIIEKFCFNDNLVNCEEYGALYSWSEMMAYNSAAGSQGICPQGFHVPMDEEWITLSDYLGGNSVAGGKMKETGFLHWMEPNTGATNESGFNAIGSGFLNPYVLLNYSSYMWSSTVAQPMKAYYRYLMFDSPILFRASIHGMSSGFSLRCLKDTESQSWSCGDPLLDNRDYQQYNTVQIGNQCWMAENINIGNKVSPTGQSDNGIIEKQCYGEVTSNCYEYGGLYQWAEAMQYSTTAGTQGICPAGWQIPDEGDWTILEDFLGGSSVAGGKMKSTGTIESGTGLWNAPNTGATNESGFSGLPGGIFVFNSVSYAELGTSGYFWSSSQYNSTAAWWHGMYNTWAGIEDQPGSAVNGFSVRCIKACTPQPTQSNAGPDQLNMYGTSTMLAGNSPVNGTGLWSIVSGTGGTIVNPSSPASEFQGMEGHEYTLVWTITTSCGSSSDNVVISFGTVTFSCGNNLVYEGQSYATVLIGTQCWMAQNLNVGTQVNPYEQSNNGITEKLCYDNNVSNCNTYGGLYEWNEMMNYSMNQTNQGICPSGWRVPMLSEWETLISFLGGASVAGGKLKEIGFTHWSNPNTGATNESGFTAIGGGRYGDGYGLINLYGDYWTSFFNGEDQVLKYVRYDAGSIESGYSYYEYRNANSVRCIMDGAQ